MFSQTIMESSLNWILSDLTTWDKMSTSDLLQAQLFYSSFLFPVTITTTRNQSKKLIVLLWNPTILKHTQCFYVLPQLQTWTTGLRLIFVFLKIVVNTQKKSQDNQLWTPVRIHFKFSEIFISHFSLKKKRIWHWWLQKILLLWRKTTVFYISQTSCTKNSLCSELCIKKGDCYCNVIKEFKWKAG